MRYCIERDNRSVVIGHCKTPAIINDATIPYTLDEIGRRLKETKLNGFAPIYSQFGTDIYASDVVQQALKCIVDELKKLNPTHVRYKGNDPVPVRGDIQDMLDNPNPLMTTSEFIEKTAWLLLMNYNALFADDGITYRYGEITGLEPFDIVTLTNEDEVVTIGIKIGGYEILGRRERVEGLESE